MAADRMKAWRALLEQSDWSVPRQDDLPAIFRASLRSIGFRRTLYKTTDHCIFVAVVVIVVIGHSLSALFATLLHH